MSSIITGLIEDIGPHFVTVVINNVGPMIPYDYRASAFVIVNSTIIFTTIVRGRIPALIIPPTTCKIANLNIIVLYTIEKDNGLVPYSQKNWWE